MEKFERRNAIELSASEGYLRTVVHVNESVADDGLEYAYFGTHTSEEHASPDPTSNRKLLQGESEASVTIVQVRLGDDFARQDTVRVQSVENGFSAAVVVQQTEAIFLSDSSPPRLIRVPKISIQFRIDSP